MTQTACQVCGSAGHAYLCTGCTKQLHDALKDLPGGIRELQTTATRQANVGDIPPRSRRAQLEDVADVEHRAIPARLRSRQGRITLPATAMPVSLDASKLYRDAFQGVLSWAKLAGVDYGTVPTSRALYIDRNRMHVHLTRTATLTIERVIRLLIAELDTIRHSVHAGEVHAKAIDLAAWIVQTIDRRGPDVFAGRCTTTDVRMMPLLLAGAPCSPFGCAHDTCATIRAATGQLSAVVGKCNTELNADEGETAVTCEQCGTLWQLDERRQWMADEMDGKLATAREVAALLRTLEIEHQGETIALGVTVDRIDGWLKRGTITSHATNADGYRLYSVTEVRKHAEQWERRRAERRKQRTSVPA